MKCEECVGTGKVQKWFYERTGFGKYEKVCGDVKCEWCNGTGEVEQTEQEYIQTCDAEQLIRFLLWYPQNVFGYPKPKMSIAEEEDAIREWLKQPHGEGVKNESLAISTVDYVDDYTV